MALITIDPIRPIRESTYGTAFRLIPSRDVNGITWRYGFEVQRAPDSGGSPGTPVTIYVTDLPLPSSGGIVADELPPAAAYYHYRWRQVGPAYSAGAYSTYLKRAADLLPASVLAVAVNTPGVTLYRGDPFTDGEYTVKTTDTVGKPLRSQVYAGAGGYALKATETDGSTKVSSALNPQAAILPFASSQLGTFFSYAAGGPATGQMWISFGWTSDTISLPDGSTTTIPAPPAAPAAPTLSQVAGGALGARTLYARLAYVLVDPLAGFLAVYPVSAEASFAVGAGNLLKVTTPAPPGGAYAYSGWAVLVGNAANTEYVQGAGAAALISLGTDWTEPAGGFSTTANALWTTNWKSVTKIGLATSTTYYHYPYYQPVITTVLVPSYLNRTAAQAINQSFDGVFSLGSYSSSGYTGVISIATPAAAGTSSGTAGGGRLT
jgi:hypothetical protein